MAEIIKQIKLPNGLTYDIEAVLFGGMDADAWKRLIAGGVDYLGLAASATDLKYVENMSNGDFYRASAQFELNGATVHSGDLVIAIAIADEVVTWAPVHGEEFDMDHTHSINHGHEFVLDDDNVAMEALKPTGSVSITVGAGTANYTPEGDITLKHTATAGTTNPNVAGDGIELEHTHTYDKATGGSASYTPAGSVSQPTFTGTKGITSEATITVELGELDADASHSHEVTLEGSVTINHTPAGSVTVTNGNAETGVSESTEEVLKSVSVAAPGSSFAAHTTSNAAPNEHTHTATYDKTSSVTVSVTDGEAVTEVENEPAVSALTGVTAALNAAPALSNGKTSTGTTGENSASEEVLKSVTAALSATPTFTGTKGSGTTGVNSDSVAAGSATVTNNVLVLDFATVAAHTHTHAFEYTPAGTVSKPGITVTPTPVSVAKHTHTHSIPALTVSGTISKPSITITPVTADVAPAEHTHNYAKVASASATLEHTATTVTTSKNSGTAVAALTGLGKLTINAPTITPTKVSVSAADHVHSYSKATGGSFSGTPFSAELPISVTGTTDEADLQLKIDAGSANLNHSHEYTPAGTVSKPTFSGTAATITSTLNYDTEAVTGEALVDAVASKNGHTHGFSYDKTTSATFAGKAVRISGTFAGDNITPKGTYKILKSITPFTGDSGSAK